GRAADPWLLNCDPSAPNFHVEGLALPPDVGAARFECRRSLVHQVNRDLDALARSDRVAVFDAQQRRALDLVTGAQTRRAFNLHEEPLPLRERYGATKF